MKKVIAKLLKQTWLYILCAELLLIFLFQLVDTPGRLYSLLPESWYDVWEDFAAIHMERYLAVSLLILILLSGILAFCSLFSLKVRGGRKAIMVMFYVLLTFIACGILLPRLGRAREKTKRISCSSNLKQIYLALQQYTLDYESHLPPDLKTLSGTDYLTDKGVYHCPNQNRPNSEFSDYLYYGAGHKLDENPPFLLLRDRDKNHPGEYWNLLMSNGERIQRNDTVSND